MTPTHLTLFDLDHTLIPIDSDQSWGAFTTHVGWTDALQFGAQNDAFYNDYCRGELDIRAYIRFTTAAIRARSPAESKAMQERFMQEVIRPQIKPEAMELVRYHRDKGDLLMIVTATNEWVTRPIAQCFGIDELIAVELERDAQGHLTGEIAGVPSLGAGKLQRVQMWLQDKGWTSNDLKTTFYSDSINDVPLLSWVQHPVATNPDERLRDIALQQGWEILELFDKT